MADNIRTALPPIPSAPAEDSTLDVRPRQRPPFFDPARDAYIVTRHEDVTAMLRDPRVSIETVTDVFGADGSFDFEAVNAVISGFPLTVNGPLHETTRKWAVQALKTMAPAFSAESVAAETRALCRAHPAGVPFDALTTLCDMLPVHLLGRGVGLPPAVIARIAATGGRLFRAVYSGSGRRGLTQRGLDQYNAAADRVIADTIAALEEAGGSPVISLDQVRAREGTPAGTFDPLMAFIFVIAAGTETSENGLANALSIGLTDENARRVFSAESAPGRHATAELIRLSTSLSFSKSRIANAAIAGEGWTIPAGARIILILEQANFDPAVYPAPNVFCPAAGRATSVSFGGGPHRCTGAAIATTMITSFLRVTLGEENIMLDHADFEREPYLLLRRPRSLMVTRNSDE